MKPIRLILSGMALSVALGSCQKQDHEPQGMTDSGYRLTGINSSDGKAIRFRYDGNNRIERIEYGRGNFGSEAFDVLDTYYEYKYQRGRCIRIFSRCLCDSDSRWRSFVYDGDGRITLAESHAADGRFESFTRYRYDGAGRLAETRDSAASVVTERRFVYGPSENLSSMTVFRYGDGGTTRERREWRDYDTGHSYIHEIPGLPIDDPNLEMLRGYISWAKNNYLTERLYLPVPDNQPQTSYVDRELIYRYDSRGLPVQLSTAGLQMKFSYEPY